MSLLLGSEAAMGLEAGSQATGNKYSKTLGRRYLFLVSWATCVRTGGMVALKASVWGQP